MSYFSFDGIIQLQSLFSLEGEEAQHLLKSRRIRLEESIEIQDIQNRRYHSTVKNIGRKSLDLLPFEEIPTPPESPIKIHLYQSLVKEKALDHILQKVTELGVNSIFLFQSQFSPVTAKNLSHRNSRWEKIVLEACKQSGRALPPKIELLGTLQQCLQQKERFHSPTWCLHPSPSPVKGEAISTVPQEINILIGPEGGFSNEEIESFPFPSIQMGPRILRADTAAVTAIGVLQFLYGDLAMLQFKELSS